MRLYLGAILLGVLASAAATARECHGIRFPDRLAIAGSELALNGLGLRQATIFKVNVYVAALYVRQASSSAADLLAEAPPKQLVMQFVRNVSANELRERFEEGLQKAAGAQLPALKERIAMFDGWMVDVKSGDRMSLSWLPDHSVQLEFNGRVQGHIAGEDFGRVLLRIWLGSQPPNPELKAGLLGGSCG